MKKGLFITIEGPDGAGKSTQIDFIKRYFEEKGIEAIFTREPGGTSISEKIREIILDKNNAEMDYMTEAMLYAAARAQLVNQVILPAVRDGKVVVCDRFVDSSIAYQGYGRKLGDVVEIINGYVIGECIPDLTLLLKLDSEKGMSRIEENGTDRKGKDRLELEKISFHREVLRGYLELEQKYERIIGIDAGQSIEDVSNDIRAELDRVLKGKYEL